MKFEHIGWCKDGIHDKVWGLILIAENVPLSEAWPFLTNKYLLFWGRRGAKLQTKIENCSEVQSQKLFEKKLNKGYIKIYEDELHKVYPNFKDDLEKTAIWASLKL